MQLSNFINISIEGLSVALPDQILEIKSLIPTFGEENIHKFIKMTGVEAVSRAIEEQTASDLGYEAAINLIKEKDVNVDDIKILILVTQKPDVRFPSTSYLLHHRLLLNSDCMCFDINLACSGFVYGLNTIMSLLSNYEMGSKALLITADTSIKSLAPKDRTVSMLFGDSGSALLLSKIENDKEFSFASRSDGHRFKTIITPAGGYRNRNLSTTRTSWSDDIMRSDYDTHMKGMEVFAFSITDIPKLIKEFIEEANLNYDEIDCFALHQANKYMLHKIAKKLKIPMEKVPIAIHKYGNNSSNSIPLVLSEEYGHQDSNEQFDILGCGFGAGLSWAVGYFSMSINDVLPIIKTNNFYRNNEKY